MTQAHHQAFNPAVVDGVDVDAVAAAVLACAGVARMSRGLLGEAATYLPGRRVYGVVIGQGRNDDRPDIDVRVVAALGPTMLEIADQVRHAVSNAAPGRSVTVAIDDIDLGDGSNMSGAPHSTTPAAASAG